MKTGRRIGVGSDSCRSRQTDPSEAGSKTCVVAVLSCALLLDTVIDCISQSGRSGRKNRQLRDISGSAGLVQAVVRHTGPGYCNLPNWKKYSARISCEILLGINVCSSFREESAFCLPSPALLSHVQVAEPLMNCVLGADWKSSLQRASASCPSSSFPALGVLR